MFGEGKKKVQGNAEKTSSNLANVLDKKATLHLALGTPCSLCCMNSQTEELYGFLYSDRVCSCWAFDSSDLKEHDEESLRLC